MKFDFQRARPFIGLGVLVVLVLAVFWWLGAFTPEETDAGQINKLNERFVEETNDHDWDGLLNLCWFEYPERRKEWLEGIPGAANAVRIEAMNYNRGFSVPAGATEFELEVNIVARIGPWNTTHNRDSRTGVVRYKKIDGRWLIDIDKSAPGFVIPIPARSR
jgi:hypothetical protein